MPRASQVISVVLTQCYVLACVVEAGHVEEALVDNVAESGDESEDEWNYFNGQSERDQNPTEEPDELPRSDTPGHDNVRIYPIICYASMCISIHLFIDCCDVRRVT